MCLSSDRENPFCLDLKGLSSCNMCPGSWTLKTEHLLKALCQGSLTICALCGKKAEGELKEKVPRSQGALRWQYSCGRQGIIIAHTLGFGHDLQTCI